jgi:coenzyme F420-reducing hydrogenase beta subunit
MRYDQRGFAYPDINKELCVDCRNCEKSCPYLNTENMPEQTVEQYPPVYACYIKDETIRKASTSGGVFSALAEKIIDDGGIVFAARFDRNFHIVHGKTQDKNEIHAFRGSKYAQSEIDYCYREIKEIAKEGKKKVLFVGTPCQVAGLRQYLNRDYDTLFLTDFICMGIAPPVIWEKYLLEFEDISRLQAVVFKDKRYGWHDWKMRIIYPDKERFLWGMENPFFNGYLTHLYTRPSCLSCPFKGIIRLSDFTIGDCWGIDKIDPAFDDDKGVSLLILQSEKARGLFETIKDRMAYRPINAGDVMRYNRYSLLRTPENPKTGAFYDDLEKYGFKKAMRMYCTPKKTILSRINRIKWWINRFIKKVITR